MLKDIRSPEDLRSLKPEELKQLCEEIRQELIQTVSRNGGHLASNLGVVELTVALHRVFHMPEDRIIFDVGHQTYVHKLLTGRQDLFATLREYGGLAGFPRRSESPFDVFETGHASTSISAALGMARARDYRKEKYHVVAVLGDGALTGGMCYEALNDAGNSKTRLIVVLNDNEMSIAPNVGAVSNYLTSLRISAGWRSAKKKVRHLSDVPVVGRSVYRVIHGSKKLLKSVLVRETTDLNFFEALGFEYFGPIDGHDLVSMERAFQQATLCSGPCVLHVLTRKGQGYEQAEARPETFHGTPPFFIETGNRVETPECPSCGHVMADTLADMAEKDPRVVAITAAMKLGTGLDHFGDRFPDRLMDVGIAEEHGATMAAGLAAGGMRPYFAVYASFFQRCFDQVVHDVCMQGLPVTFLLDRSGVGGEDGKTHHGVLDFAQTLPIPGLTVLAPCDSRELQRMLQWTLTTDGPCVIRYAKSGKPIPTAEKALPEQFRAGIWNPLREGKDGVILAVGSMVRRALRVSETLEKEGLRLGVINCSSVKPLDGGFLGGIPDGTPFFTMEEHMLTGGFGMLVSEWRREHALSGPREIFAVRDQYLQHGAHERLMEDAGLTESQMAGRIRKILKEKKR